MKKVLLAVLLSGFLSDGALADTMDPNMAAPLRFGMVRTEIDDTSSRGLGLLHWDTDAWYGGDQDKFWIKSEGVLRGSGADEGEIQALWSRNVSDFWDFQTGVREDFAPSGNTYITLGFEGLAKDFFETQAHLFISTGGEVSARAKQSLDLAITQQLFIEPHGEINFAAQNIPRQRLGVGISNLELGLQTRYEITRKVAPYVDIVWTKALGNTIRYDRTNAEPPDELTVRGGLRMWF